MALQATRTIPIVFIANGDPVRDGVVASLSRPGGNATSITIFGGAAVTKRLQLLHEIVPKAATTAYLMNPSNPNAEIEMRAAQSAAASLGQQMTILSASNARELDAGFAAMARLGVGALLIASDASKPMSENSADVSEVVKFEPKGRPRSDDATSCASATSSSFSHEITRSVPP